MNTLRDPVGPESKGVYLRRRLLVLGGLLAIIVFVVLVIVKPGSSGGAASAPEVKVPDEIVAADKVQNDTPKAGETEPCPTGELAVTPLIDRDSYAAGELPMLSLRVENTGAKKCEAQLGADGLGVGQGIQSAGQAIENLLLLGVEAGRLGLALGIGRQPAGDERGRQIDEQVEHVARVGHVESVVGHDEKEVDGEKAGHGGQHRWPRAQAHGSNKRHQHVEQRIVGQCQLVAQG